MSALEAEVLCPGHGIVIHRKNEIKTCLMTAADYLLTIQNHVEACLNKGMQLEETIDTLNVPSELFNSKWLPPIYGHPCFIARSIFHRYAGYYSGDPATLFPPKYSTAAKEIISLSGGVMPVLQRAKELQAKGQPELACQLAVWAVKGAPHEKACWEIYGMLFKKRAENEINMQARGAYNQAVREAVFCLENLDKLQGNSVG